MIDLNLASDPPLPTSCFALVNTCYDDDDGGDGDGDDDDNDDNEIINILKEDQHHCSA